MRQQTVAWSIVLLVCMQLVLPALALPQPVKEEAEGRKFAVKPNSNKKVTTETNEITPQDNGFSWGNILGTLVHMFLGSSGLDKSDSGVNGVQGGFNWMSLVNLGLRLMLSALNSDGVDKADSPSGASPMQLLQLISSLLDALKVSFSQRSTNARSLGAKDPFSDAGIAAVTIMKGYVNTHKTHDEVCMQRLMCEANNECARDAPDSGYLFCQLGTYAASYLLEKSTFTPLDAFTNAGRRGRTGENCAQIFQQCNEL